MAAAEAAPVLPPSPGEVKRSEGEEWCDSGLGSLGEGQLGLLPTSPGSESVTGGERPEEDEEGTEVVSPSPVRAVDPAAWLRHVLSFLTEDGDTALHLAVIHEHEAFLDSILQHTAGTEYLDLQNDLGQTALHLAVILGLSSFVGKLKAAGASLGVQERRGHTPLHLACREEGRGSCASSLLGPLPKCCQREEEEETLPQQGRKEEKGEREQLESLNYDGYTPLHLAVLRKDLQLVELLLRAGADPNKPEPSCGRSPLHLAVEAQSPEVVECLLRAGAEPAPQMFGGCTPLGSAQQRADPRLPPLLRSYGAPEPFPSEEEEEEESEEEEEEEEEEQHYDDIVLGSRHLVG